MVSHKTTVPDKSGSSPPEKAIEQLVIERSADPLVLLASILTVAGALAAQWGEEILLHLRVASLNLRLGKKIEAIQYLRYMADLHSVDAFHIGPHGTKQRIDMMRFFLIQVEIDENLLYSEDHKKKRRIGVAIEQMKVWKRFKKIAAGLRDADFDRPLLSQTEEEVVDEIVKPSVTWLKHAYLTPVRGETRYALVQELNAIKEYADPDESARQLLKLFDHCRHWHERKSDTPIWVHELDDIGTRAMYLAVMIDRPNVIVTYLERCIDALNERPLALMPNVAIALGALGYMARKLHRDELLHRALDFLPRLPEHERCIAALALVEVLVERESKI